MVYPKYDRTLKFGEGKSTRHLKETVALVTRVGANGGIWPTVFGHCSARIAGNNRIYITPHFHWQGRVLQEVTADDVRVMALGGNPLEGESIDIAEERCFHTEVYKARPDVGGVIYGHPRLSNAFADAGRDTLTVFGSKAPLIPSPGWGSAVEVGQAVAKGLGKNNRAVFWPSTTFIGPAGSPTAAPGGTVVVGKTIEEACVTAFLLEREAEMQLFMTVLGAKPPKPVSGEKAFTPEQLAKQIEVQTALQFPYFAAMDRGPCRETRGLLFWP